MRAGGMSVWQFLRPGIVVALLLGVVQRRPSSTRWRRPGATAAEKPVAEAFGKEANLSRGLAGTPGCARTGPTASRCISAASASNRGLTLTGVTAFVFDTEGHFVERVDAPARDLRDGFWEIRDAWVVRLGREPEKFDTYLLSTYLTPDRVTDALGTPLSVSFWELPGLIEVAEKAKLSASRLAHPVRSSAVAAAAVRSDGPFGGNCVVGVIPLWGHPDYGHHGLVGGFGFFLMAEVSRQIGVAGLAPPWAAIWLPVVLVMFVSATVLLHQEDG